MNYPVFLRRKSLGASSCKGMASFIGGEIVTSAVDYVGNNVAVIRNDRLDLIPDYATHIIRWGCTSRVPEGIKILNKAKAIHSVNNKAYARQITQALGVAPYTIFDVEGQFKERMVLRPTYHAQGRNLYLVETKDQAIKAIETDPKLHTEGFYLSEYIPKVAEYRVYVMHGRVVTVAEKTVEDPSAIAWNVAQGGVFKVVPWGQWDLAACEVSLKAFAGFECDFAGVDVMVDAEGKAYVIELNSAPSLPFLSDGSISYRQKCMGKAFKYTLENGEAKPATKYDCWMSMIHPGIWVE